MPRVILIMTIMLSILTGCSKQTPMILQQKVEETTGVYQKISVQEAKEMMDSGSYDIILDVRTLAEYNEGHIEEAIVLPDNEIREKAEETLDDKQEVILVYCRSGKRSEAASKELTNMGYINVYDFGGIMSWPYEIVKE